ncbi:hypothetical protein SOVF_095100 isoform A [Spinacia oleracea]|uniref:Cysteine-rich receptor-like protein kinase 43 n=1 Tax=Spinacia oleracea TaxID=3562 RepID=A0A9R0J840_SPIOL|nr:cysteine-rich receptor-like protein kinase 43 [Spinacia oleracea]KNA15769.1 hypothetical protein SOVF_095100 isoform A [Spinacia oleracea]
MEITPHDITAFLSEQPLGREDAFGRTLLGHIPANNSYGLAEMNVAIRVSHPRREGQDENLHMQFKNELKLCFLKHRNIIGLIGFSETKENFYLVYEMVQARPLSELVKGLTWEQALKVLKGTVSGLAFLHSHPEGPFVHSNISTNSILVTKDFVPKIVDFRCCVVEGQKTTHDNPRYYPSQQEGAGVVKADIFAFGLVALQLITKDGRTAYAVEEGLDMSPRHILDLYVPMFKEKGNLVHASYGQEKESRKITEMIFNCLKKDSQLDLKSFHRDLVLLSLAKQC